MPVVLSLDGEVGEATKWLAQGGQHGLIAGAVTVPDQLN